MSEVTEALFTGVRRAEHNDADYKKLIDMGARFIPEHEMGALSGKNHDVRKIMQWIVTNISCAAWIAEIEGEAVGSIGLHETTTWYSNQVHLEDGWFYVVPEHRESGIGIMLLNAAKQFAKEQRLPLLVGIFNMKDVEMKVNMLQRHGFKLAGGLFLAGE